MNIPTAEEFLDAKSDYMYSPTTTIDIMIEFAKLHVEAALEAAANEYYPRDRQNFELIAERFINAYSLTNIK
jgi:hypothetical protein